jgi:hypothetical protein
MEYWNTEGSDSLVTYPMIRGNLEIVVCLTLSVLKIRNFLSSPWRLLKPSYMVSLYDAGAFRL